MGYSQSFLVLGLTLAVLPLDVCTDLGELYRFQLHDLFVWLSTSRVSDWSS